MPTYTHGCQTCCNFGKISRIIVSDDGKRTVGPPEICPECDGKGK